MTQYYGNPNKSIKLIKVPKSVQNEAKLAFALRDIGFKGATATGWKRALQLTGEMIPIEDVLYMRNWYARHIYTSYPTFKEWKKSGKSKSNEWHNKRGIIAWLTWGGDSGLKFVNSMTPLLNKTFNKNYLLID